MIAARAVELGALPVIGRRPLVDRAKRRARLPGAVPRRENILDPVDRPALPARGIGAIFMLDDLQIQPARAANPCAQSCHVAPYNVRLMYPAADQPNVLHARSLHQNHPSSACHSSSVSPCGQIVTLAAAVLGALLAWSGASVMPSPTAAPVQPSSSCTYLIPARRYCSIPRRSQNSSNSIAYVLGVSPPI